MFIGKVLWGICCVYRVKGSGNKFVLPYKLY